jgi:hypothetical protein
MLISHLISRLNKLRDEHGDLDVMFQSDNGDAWEVALARHHKVAEDEYPQEWNMPTGYEFIKLSN